MPGKLGCNKFFNASPNGIVCYHSSNKELFCDKAKSLNSKPGAQFNRRWKR